MCVILLAKALPPSLIPAETINTYNSFWAQNVIKLGASWNNYWGQCGDPWGEPLVGVFGVLR